MQGRLFQENGPVQHTTACRAILNATAWHPYVPVGRDDLGQIGSEPGTQSFPIYANYQGTCEHEEIIAVKGQSFWLL